MARAAARRQQRQARAARTRSTGGSRFSMKATRESSERTATIDAGGGSSIDGGRGERAAGG